MPRDELVIMMSTYEERRGHPADFLVDYRFYPAAEGGRPSAPGQYYRGDFMFFEDAPDGAIHMIHHEFLDEGGVIFPEATSPVPERGGALMWIVSPRTRSLVRGRVEVGVRYFIMEGSRRVGEGVVTAVLGMRSNPLS